MQFLPVVTHAKEDGFPSSFFICGARI